jgi:shikimate dehydrogenase
VGTDIAQSAPSGTGFVNATPIGMEKHPGSAVRFDLLRPHQWVADIVYFPLETVLLREARARGCPTLDGSGMAVFQAASAFEIFTGLRPDRGRMLDSFVESIRNPMAGRGVNALAALDQLNFQKGETGPVQGEI